MNKQTMLAVLKEKTAPGITIKQVAIPEPKDEEVLVKVRHASICGTDIGIYNWIPWAEAHIKPPQIMGHEMVGEIIAINTKEKTHLKVGDLVSLKHTSSAITVINAK